MMVIPIKELKQQHAEVCDLMKVLSILFKNEEVRYSKVTFRLFEELISSLKNHFSLEDKTLYPNLLTHEDSEVKKVAGHFVSGTKAINQFFVKYAHQWSNIESAKADTDAFLRETEGLFDFLKKRIDAEEKQFFAIVEKKDLQSKDLQSVD
jgi:hemerythrin-like domain-containing protein